MKAKPLPPKKLLLRCLALEKRGYWVAICIDLDLSVQATTPAQARKLLSGQIASYVADAVSVDVDQAEYLLSRRAPLRYVAMYYMARLINANKHRQGYRAAMPLVPMGA